PVLLELGGKSPAIVFEDADLRRAGTLAAVLSLSVNAGQGCVLPTRLLVQDSVYDEVVERVLATARSFRLGNPLTEGTTMGPVLTVVRFRDEDEAVALANDSDYGLGAFVYTRELARAHRMAGALDAGMVAINGMSPMLPTMPFGGIKQSGFGREGGRAGFDE